MRQCPECSLRPFEWVKVPPWHGLIINFVIFSFEWSHRHAGAGYLIWTDQCKGVRDRWIGYVLLREAALVYTCWAAWSGHREFVCGLWTLYRHLYPRCCLRLGRDRQRYKDILGVMRLSVTCRAERAAPCTRGQHLNDTTSHFSCQHHREEFLLFLYCINAASP